MFKIKPGLSLTPGSFPIILTMAWYLKNPVPPSSEYSKHYVKSSTK